MLAVTVVIYWIACGIYSGEAAIAKGHGRWPWFFGGLFFGPVALVMASGLPDLKLRRYIRLMAENQGVNLPAESDD